jgi:hypothetical protein
MQSAFERNEELKRAQELYLKYVRTIVRFFVDPLHDEDWDMVWMLRWNSPFSKPRPRKAALYQAL